MRIIIEVEGGLVQEVKSDTAGIEVSILDMDAKHEEPDRYDEDLEREFDALPFTLY